MSSSVVLPDWSKDLNGSDNESMVRKISNSEVSGYLQCERKWYYGYALNLEPVSSSIALSRGVIGHEALAAYYQGLMDGKPIGTCESDAIMVVMGYMSQAFDTTMLTGLVELLRDYFVFAAHDGWKILAVERMYEIPVNDVYTYVMRLDLVARLQDGRIALIDHKFVYDFWSQDDLDLNPQMPKYIGTLRYNKNQIDVGVVNQVRHRTKKGPMTFDEKFKRSYVSPTQPEIKQVMKEQFQASDQIEMLRALPDMGESTVLRTMNKMTCKNCSFINLCRSDLMGQDTTLMRKVDYRQNVGYGYNVEKVES